MAKHDIEFERTFLAGSRPLGLELLESVNVIDCYLPPLRYGGHPRLRARRQGQKCQLTKKLPISRGDASMHSEFTVDLTIDEFESLKNATDRILEKQRYAMPISGYIAEVDVFLGTLSGLVLIDFEFKTLDELHSFSVPDICLADVTQEDFIAGGLLAGKSYSDIADKLVEFKYVAIQP